MPPLPPPPPPPFSSSSPPHHSLGKQITHFSSNDAAESDSIFAKPSPCRRSDRHPTGGSQQATQT